jgi:hypothetical protein
MWLWLWRRLWRDLPRDLRLGNCDARCILDRRFRRGFRRFHWLRQSFGSRNVRRRLEFALGRRRDVGLGLRRWRRRNIGLGSWFGSRLRRNFALNRCFGVGRLRDSVG